MSLIAFLISFVVSATGITITEPEDWTDYNLDDLPGIRAIVENDNVVPDLVNYSLNGAPVVSIPRLNTDWPTYMQNYQNHGYSESPAPLDNTILWTASVTGDVHEFPTPVVVDGMVYYPSNSGTDSLYALDAGTGELIWKQRVGGVSDDAATVLDGRIYIASDSIFCFDSLSGERFWASGDADWTGSTPVVMEGKVFCGTADQSEFTSTIYSLNSSTGMQIWSKPLSGYTASCISVWNEMIFVPTFNDWNPTPLYALNAETGDVVWENSDNSAGYWDSSPVVVNGVIYINGVDGIARGIDAVSGSTVWESVVGYTTATSAYHEGRLYFANDFPTASYHSLDALSGVSIWTTSGSQHGSSAIADGVVFYGDNINRPEYSSIVALDCATGSEIWSYSADSSVWIAGSPSITDGVVYMAMHDWNLYAFGTGLKYTYLDETLNPEVGWNELVTTSFDSGIAVASDTVNFYINPTGIEFEPSRRLLLTGSPNPFSCSTELSFSLSEPGFTSVEIYDLTGRCISNLIDNDLSQGEHTVNWGGMDQNGNGVPPGLYMCRIQSGGVIETTGLCLLR